MKYVSQILCAAFVCGILSRLSPEKKNGGFVRFAASVAFLGVLAAPITAYWDSVISFGDFLRGLGGKGQEITDATVDNTVAREICSAATKLAADHFGVEKDSFEIKLVFGTDSSGRTYIAKCGVKLKEDVADASAVERFFEEIIGCEVTVNSE